MERLAFSESRREVSVASKLPDASPFAGATTSAEATALGLQRTIGNRAFSRLLRNPGAASGSRNSRVLARDAGTTPDLDVVVVPEDERRPGGPKPDLPKVSAQSADPRTNQAYVDGDIRAAAWNIYLGGPLLWFKALENQQEPWTTMLGLGGCAFVPDNQFIYSRNHIPSAVDLAVYPDRATAIAHMPAGPFTADTAPVGYYWTRGGLIAPTVFSPWTAPNVIQTVVGAMRVYAEQVSDELTVLAIGLAAGLLLNFAFQASSLFRAKPASGTPDIPATDLEQAAAKARTAKPAEPTAGDAPAGQAGAVGRILRRRLTPAQIRALDPFDYVTFRTSDETVAREATLEPQGNANKNLRDKVCFADGLEGFNYGEWHVSYKKGDIPGLHPVKDFPGEWMTDRPVPPEKGNWYHHDDWIAAKKQR